MPKTRRRAAPRKKRRSRRQHGGLFPLAAAIPALLAAGKAATLGAISGAAAYGGKKALKRVMKGKRRSHRPSRYQYE